MRKLKLLFSLASKVDDTKSETPETSDLKTQQYMDQLLDLKKEDYDMLGCDFEYVLADLPTAASRSKGGSYSSFGYVERQNQPLEISKCSKIW